MKRVNVIVWGIIFLMVGCITTDIGDHGSRDPVNSVAIIVALTKVDYKAYSGWDGICAGSNTDLDRMVKTCRKAGIERVVSLYNEKATTYAVIRQILLACKSLEASAKAGKSPLLFFYFSGHGGSVYDFFRKEKNSMNQTLCLWDGQMVDDLMWDVLLKIPKGIRVVHITDCCEAGSNYRGMGPFIAKEYKDIVFRPKITRRLPEDLSCDFLHLGGCADGEVSKGNVTYGGIFTYTLLITAKPDGKSYYQWFEETKSGMPRIGQVPTMEVLQSEESIFNNGKIEDGPAMK
jgi:hypothetical protein